MQKVSLPKRLERIVAAAGVRRDGHRFPYFHRLGDEPICDSLTGTCEHHTVTQFERFLAWFVQHHAAVSPDHWIAFHGGASTLPANAAIISFDDGYADNYDFARPLLDEYGVRATFFVVASIVDTANGLSSAQLRALQAEGHTIGAHTDTHQRLTDLSLQAARHELVRARTKLEDIVGAPCVHMSYPYGSFSSGVIDLVADAGYKTAFTSREAGNQRSSDLLQLARTKIWPSDDSGIAYGVRMRGIHEWRNWLRS